VGTNGELVVGNKERLISSSCATGPALEGAQIEFGMRAAPGAIERVTIDPETHDVDYKVIGRDTWRNFSTPGEMKTKGICGSGILDVMAQMFLAGIIDKSGAFSKKQPSNRFMTDPETGIKFFVLAWAKETSIGKDNRTVGYFTGLIVKKFGFKILGSPFPGWSTFYMGFNLRTEISRAIALEALTSFVFKDLKCDHIELMDRHMSTDDYRKLGYKKRIFDGYEIDLRPSEEKIFRNMKHQCRNCIRKAEKSGVVIEEARDIGFAAEYCAQLNHVIAINSSIPQHRTRLVMDLEKFIYPTGRLLLLRARNKNGICIATGIFPAMSNTMYALGQASWRHYSNVRPNEAMFWYAMKFWKRRGMQFFDMLGRGDYKRKYGGYRIEVPWIRKSKNDGIAFLRNTARTVIRKRRATLGKIANMVERFKQRNIRNTRC